MEKAIAKRGFGETRRVRNVDLRSVENEECRK